MSAWARLCGHAVASLQTRLMAPVDLPGLVLLRILGQSCNINYIVSPMQFNGRTDFRALHAIP